MKLIKEKMRYKDSPQLLFPKLPTPIDQKKMLYFSNAFTLFDGVFQKKKVFVIELSYLTEDTLSKSTLLSQYQENTIKYIPDNKHLVRIGIYYDKSETLLSIIYDKGNMNPLLLQKDSSLLQRYQYFYSLLNIVSSVHQQGYSLGLIHPGLIFLDETLKLCTLDNCFYTLIPLLLDKAENIQVMSYYGYFVPNVYDKLIGSYSSQAHDNLFLKADIVLLCVLFKYLFSNNKSYDTILCECEVYMNSLKATFAIENEPELSKFLDSVINKEYQHMSSIKEIIQLFTPIFSNETKKVNANLSAFVCLRCGIKYSAYSTFHKCEEKKEKKKRDLQTKEMLAMLSEQIDNLPHLKTVTLYDQYYEKENMLYQELELLNGDIAVLIANEEKKFNIIMNYAQNMFNIIEKNKRKALTDKVGEFEDVIKQLTNDFVSKIKEIRNISLMSIKKGKRREGITKLESGSLYSYITTLEAKKAELKEREKEYEEFVKNAQKILGHANYEAKLEDLMNKIKEEYLKFIKLRIENLYSFHEKIEENNEILKKGVGYYNKMKTKLDALKNEEDKSKELNGGDDDEEKVVLNDLLKHNE